MLYGHKEIVDNRVATLVTSATTVEEYDEFLKLTQGQSTSKRNFSEVYTSQALQHLTEDVYRGFKKPVHVFYHQATEDSSAEARAKGEAMREAFLVEWNIKVLENGIQSRDKQRDMIFEDNYRKENEVKTARDAEIEAAEAEGREYTGEREPTLGEKYGLTEHDPYDRRSETEKAYDDEMRRMMKAAKEAGTMSDDSFSYPTEPAGDANPDKMKPGDMKPSNGQLNIIDTDALIDQHGNLDISKIQAVKTGGPVDENLRAERERQREELKAEKLGGRKQFSPEDFARVLAGDGSADHLGIRGDKDIRAGIKPVDRTGLSDAAEEARKEIADREKAAMDQTKNENDFKHKQERDQGIFRGADLFGEEDIDWDDLDAALQVALQDAGVRTPTVSMKDYPFNSQIGNKSIIPFDNFGAPITMDKASTSIVGQVNVTIEGTMNMGETAAAVMSLTDPNKPGYVVYQRTGGRIGNRVITSVVRIR